MLILEGLLLILFGKQYKYTSMGTLLSTGIIQRTVLPAGPSGRPIPCSTLHCQPLGLYDYFLSVGILSTRATSYSLCTHYKKECLIDRLIEYVKVAYPSVPV